MEGSKSVIGYLEENPSDLVEYFTWCKGNSKNPNYSEFCRNYLNGETKEGISFDSIRVERKKVTSYIRMKYNLWLELN